jgi:NADH-quinone oxidoreductase subunit G
VLDCDPLDDAPVLDLRIRKGLRRHDTRVAVASARPTALDGQAAATLRHAPGGAAGLLLALDAVLTGDDGTLGGAATAAGTNAQAVRDLAGWLRDAGEDLVIVYGDRAMSGDGPRALLNLADRLGLRARAGAGLLEIPSVPNARGIREAGFAPGHGPGYGPVDAAGRDARAIAEALASAELSTIWLNYADPVRFHPDRALWNRALGTAQAVIAVESVLTETVREHADVVFPGEAYPEKEGTLTNVDGRVQRLRQAIGRPKGRSGLLGTGVRPVWQVIADVAQACGTDLGVLSGPMASAQLFAATEFYGGLTLDAIGGRGIRWPETAAGQAWRTEWQSASLDVPPAAPSPNGSLRLGTWRSLWAAKEVDASPLLKFLRVRQIVELSPEDAARLGVRDGDRVELGGLVTAPVKLRAAVPPGSVFLVEGAHDQPANVLTEPLVEVRRA